MKYKTLKLHLRNIDTYKGIDKRTVEARYTHWLTKNWLSTTQAWSWKGGDAIVVMADDSWGRLTGLFVVRQGDKIEVHEAEYGGIQGALKTLGIAENTTVA
jgi:hypothetical protein